MSFYELLRPSLQQHQYPQHSQVYSSHQQNTFNNLQDNEPYYVNNNVYHEQQQQQQYATAVQRWCVVTVVTRRLVGLDVLLGIPGVNFVPSSWDSRVAVHGDIIRGIVFIVLIEGSEGRVKFIGNGDVKSDCDDDDGDSIVAFASLLLLFMAVSHVLLFVRGTTTIDMETIRLLRILQTVHEKTYPHATSMTVSLSFKTLPATPAHLRPGTCVPLLLFTFGRDDTTTSDVVKSMNAKLQLCLQHVDVGGPLMIDRLCASNASSNVSFYESTILSDSLDEAIVDWLTSHVVVDVNKNASIATPVQTSSELITKIAAQLHSGTSHIDDVSLIGVASTRIDKSPEHGIIVPPKATKFGLLRLPDACSLGSVVDSLAPFFIFDKPGDTGETFATFERAYAALTVELPAFLDPTVSLSRSLCDTFAVPRAMQAYKQDLPAHYTNKEHVARLQHAIKAYSAYARGIYRKAALRRVIDDCTAVWEQGRRSCETLSLSGRRCVLARHDGAHDSEFTPTSACECGESIAVRDDAFGLAGAEIAVAPCCRKYLGLQLKTGWMARVLGSDSSYRAIIGLQDLRPGFTTGGHFLFRTAWTLRGACPIGADELGCGVVERNNSTTKDSRNSSSHHSSPHIALINSLPPTTTWPTLDQAMMSNKSNQDSGEMSVFLLSAIREADRVSNVQPVNSLPSTASTIEDTHNVEGFVGFEYECCSGGGLRFIASPWSEPGVPFIVSTSSTLTAPSTRQRSGGRNSRSSGSNRNVTESSPAVVPSAPGGCSKNVEPLHVAAALSGADMPLYVTCSSTCSCRATIANGMAQLQRIYVVTPDSPVRMLWRPIIEFPAGSPQVPTADNTGVVHASPRIVRKEIKETLSLPPRSFVVLVLPRSFVNTITARNGEGDDKFKSYTFLPPRRSPIPFLCRGSLSLPGALLPRPPVVNATSTNVPKISTKSGQDSRSRDSGGRRNRGNDRNNQRGKTAKSRSNNNSTRKQIIILQ